jgi:GH15 family glucan-1,4-alpha-glucosidase
MPRYGYVAADDARMVGTWRHIESTLGEGGLIYRYPPGGAYDGVEGRENLFAICNFWLVDYLARLGELERADALFERLCALGNDVGLYAEEFEVGNRRPIGNFPQAFSHEGLMTAALTHERARRGDRGRGGAQP